MNITFSDSNSSQKYIEQNTINENELAIIKTADEEIKENTCIHWILPSDDENKKAEEELLSKLRIRININEDKKEKEMLQKTFKKNSFKVYKEPFYDLIFRENLHDEYDEIYPKLKMKQMIQIEKLKEEASNIFRKKKGNKNLLTKNRRNSKSSSVILRGYILDNMY